MFYGETLFESKSIRKAAKAYLKVLPTDVTHLISRGASGCAIASAMICLSKRPLRHLFIRKGEKAHSSEVIGFRPYTVIGDITAIVDDFISTGETVKRLIEWDKDNGETVKYITVAYGGDPEQYKELGITLIQVEYKT